MAEKALNKVRKKRLFRLFLHFHFLLLPLSLSLILDPSLGKYLWLQHRQEMVRKEVAEEIKRGLERDKLVLLEFSLEEVKTKLKWRSEREFEFNRELFDVVDSVVTDNKVLFWCWHDQEEAELEKEIELVISRSLKKREKSLTIKEESNSTPRSYPFFPSGDLIFAGLDLFSILYIFFFEPNHSFDLQPPAPPPRWLI